MATVIGIDLGAYAVKLSVTSGRLGRPERTQLHARRVPLGEGGEPAELGARLAVAAALIADLSEHDAVTWAVGLPAEGVSLRLLQMPFTDRGQIEKTLGFELEGHVPFDLDSYLLDYRVLGAGADGVGARVLCALAPRAHVAQALEGLKGIDVDPRHFVLDADALGAFSDEDRVQAVVDFGHARTLVALCQGREVLGVRALSLGGRDITQALAKALGVSFEEAEAIKHQASLEPLSAGGPSPLAEASAVEASAVEASAVEAQWDDDDHTAPHAALPTPEHAAALHAAIAPLLSALRASLIALEDNIELGVEELILTGGGARLGGLTGQLAQSLGVPARRVRLNAEADAVPNPEVFGLAAALGMRGSGLTRGLELQFRKEEFTFKGDMAFFTSLVGYLAVAVIFFMVVGVGMFALRYMQARQQIEDIEGQIAEVLLETFPDVSEAQANSPSMARALMLEKTTESLARVEVLGGVVDEEPPVLGLVHALSMAMPPSNNVKIDVSDLNVSPSNINFTADTDSYEAAANIEAALQATPRLSQAKKSEERQRGGDIQFKMNIPLVIEEGEEG